MSELADLGVSWSTTVDFADDGLTGGIADIVEPGLNRDFGGRLRQIAEGHHVGIERLVGPCDVLEFAWDARQLLGIEARANDVYDPGKRQVVANHLGEELGVLASGIFARNEIRHRDARLRGGIAQSGAGVEPGRILRLSRTSAQKEQ